MALTSHYLQDLVLSIPDMPEHVPHLQPLTQLLPLPYYHPVLPLPHHPPLPPTQHLPFSPCPSRLAGFGYPQRVRPEPVTTPPVAHHELELLERLVRLREERERTVRFERGLVAIAFREGARVGGEGEADRNGGSLGRNG